VPFSFIGSYGNYTLSGRRKFYFVEGNYFLKFMFFVLILGVVLDFNFSNNLNLFVGLLWFL